MKSRRILGIEASLWLAVPLGLALEFVAAALRELAFLPLDLLAEIRRGTNRG